MKRLRRHRYQEGKGGRAIDQAQLADFANRVGRGKMLTDVRRGACFVSVGSEFTCEARGGGAYVMWSVGKDVEQGELGRERGDGRIW